MEFREIAGDGFACAQVFRFKNVTVGRENKLTLVTRRRRTVAQNRERGGYFARRAYLQMDVVALKHTPSRLDLLASPLRNRLIVVVLLPKASRNRNGKASASKGSPASTETASSIQLRS